jgi:hypothetical protein
MHKTYAFEFYLILYDIYVETYDNCEKIEIISELGLEINLEL